MEKILTITIPSYNVEKYLQQTLDSFIDDEILNDIEVLVVDDGSKDRTCLLYTSLSVWNRKLFTDMPGISFTVWNIYEEKAYSMKPFV